MNIEETMIAIDGRTGPIAAMTRTVGNMGRRRGGAFACWMRGCAR